MEERLRLSRKWEEKYYIRSETYQTTRNECSRLKVNVLFYKYPKSLILYPYKPLVISRMVSIKLGVT